MSGLLKWGSRGQAVRELQAALNQLELGPLVVDGVFGNATWGAVRTLQTERGLVVDGIVGPRTWAAIRESTPPAPWPPVNVGDVQPGPQPTTPEPLGADAARVLEVVERLPPGLVRDVLRVAAVDVGKREQPNGSNEGPEIAHLVDGYRRHWGWPPGSPAPPWCAIAVSRWIGFGLGLDPPGPSARDTPWRLAHPFKAWLGSAHAFELWGRDHGRLYPPEAARPGDVFTSARTGSGSDASSNQRAGHAGLVYAVHPWGVQTIEANVSNAVGARERRWAEIRHIVRVLPAPA